MIKLQTYLQNNNIRTLTKEEAAAFKIPWPLVRGWKVTHKNYVASPQNLLHRGKVKQTPVVSDDPFYSSDEWRSLRYSVLVKYGNQCMCCGVTPRHGAVLHVDHIKPRSKFPRLALDADNLQILCEDCNLGKSNTDSTNWSIQ